MINPDVIFRVKLSFSTKTGYPIEIIIVDSSNILSIEMTQEYKYSLSQIKFDFCHGEHDVHEKLAKEVYIGESAGVITGSFSKWWFLKRFYEEQLK